MVLGNKADANQSNSQWTAGEVLDQRISVRHLASGWETALKKVTLEIWRCGLTSMSWSMGREVQV